MYWEISLWEIFFKIRNLGHVTCPYLVRGYCAIGKITFKRSNSFRIFHSNFKLCTCMVLKLWIRASEYCITYLVFVTSAFSTVFTVDLKVRQMIFFILIHAGVSKTRSGRGGGRAETAPLLTSLPFIRTKQTFVWANTIL